MQQTRTIWTIIKESHIRIIPTKFGQNPVSSEIAVVECSTRD